MADEKPRDDAFTQGALVGDPVDERRPSHLSRQEYLERHPGRNTHQFLVEAGIAKEKTSTTRLWLALAAAFFLGALAVLLLR